MSLLSLADYTIALTSSVYAGNNGQNSLAPSAAPSVSTGIDRVQHSPTCARVPSIRGGMLIMCKAVWRAGAVAEAAPWAVAWTV